jgi:excisionase family DNA binding protein
MAKNTSQLPLTGRRYATIRETAAYLHCSERTVRRMIEDGKFPAYHLGPQIVRIDLNEVDRAAEQVQA